MCQKKIMRKRSSDHLTPDEPPRKRISPGGNVLPVQIPPGEILTDLTGKQWKLGKSIGYGGFGEIYLASDNLKEPVKSNPPYVIKVENHSNGPLFVEINCLIRIAKQQMINEWKKERKCKSLGMPIYIASGSHTTHNEKLRFLVLQRYDQDLEKIFLSKNEKFNLKTVILICKQVLDVLEYIHSKGYSHCDIKASNILHSLKTSSKVNTARATISRECNLVRYKPRNLRQKLRINYDEEPECQYKLRNLRNLNRINYDEDSVELDEEIYFDESDSKQDVKETNQMILIDYGLATKYRRTDGNHKEYCVDERKAHAGTVQFCSVDAHLGVTSRRSDLESLGYNMIYWLTSFLPWLDDVNNPELVQEKKERNLKNIDSFLKLCFPKDCPQFIYEYFKYITSLSFESKPDYDYCRNLLQTALEDYGYKNDDNFDFDNLEGWGQKPKISKKPKNSRPKTENIIKKLKPSRILVASNMLDKPILRRKSDPKIKKKLNWSILLTKDPEEILRHKKQNKSFHEVKTRERKLTDSSDSSFGGNSLHNLDIVHLNPTYAMLEIYNKCRDKNANYNSPKHNNELDHREGNTLAMDLILTKMNQRRLEEMESETENDYTKVPTRVTRKIQNKKKTQKINNGRVSPVKEMKRKQCRPVRNRGYGLRG